MFAQVLVPQEWGHGGSEELSPHAALPGGEQGECWGPATPGARRS